MKKTEYGKNARIKLNSGVNKLSEAVKTTLGPAGRNVVIKLEDQEPFATKDGVTVAGAFESDDVIEQVGIEAAKKVSADTDAKTGDGTTTATVIAQYILEKGLSFPKQLNLLDVKKGIDKASKKVVELLKEKAINIQDDLEQLYNVAMVSSNYDEEVSKAVLEAFKISGKQGIVNIKRSKDLNTTVTSVKGMNLPTGFKSREYINNYEDEVCEFENAMVFLTNKKIVEITPNFEYLFSYCSENQIPLLIICKDMDVLFENMLIKNLRNGSIKVCVCKAPGFGEEQKDLIYDISCALGCKPFIEDGPLDFEELTEKQIEELIPVSEEVFVSAQNLSIKGKESLKDEMEARADMLREQIEKHTNSYEKSILQARISRLTDGIAFIHIGAYTDLEFVEKQHRIQDALYAVKYANEEGILPGGGSALFSISKTLKAFAPLNKSEAYGFEIISEAIRMPLIQICKNAGRIIEYENKNLINRIIEFLTKNDEDYIDEEMVLAIEKNFNYGFDVKTYEVKDMMKANIIDPLRVTRVAVENAASISGLLLTTECVIVDSESYRKRRYYNE